MKRGFRIAGIVLLVLAGLSVLAFLLARSCFREQTAAYLHGLQRTQRVALLRAAVPFAPDTVQFDFRYRQDTARTREIGAYFRLDTLVDPAAPTWERALELARFVARNIPHANQKIQPVKRNAIALWEYHLDVEPAFNCRLHAILLHELLLASDITNRFVTCLPADSLDTDCHVVNQIWLPEQQKWAMLDSDQHAFVTDSEGTPLSLSEMRARYLSAEPMEVHPLLGGAKDFDYYGAYWAKNLYWFECWEHTGYDQEVRNDGRTVALLPPGYPGFDLGASTVATSDEARFWAAPAPDTNI